MKISIEYGSPLTLELQDALLKAKTDMRNELRSSPQPVWSRSCLRSRTGLRTAPCSSSHLSYLNPLRKLI